jgi:dihydrofolate reductase
MKISLIVAMASNRVIGLNNRLPWHLSADLKKFKQLTLHHPILMGRKTFESIGRPLPDRINIVISRDLSYRQSGCHVYHHIADALAYCREYSELFVIGGASFYRSLLPIADCIYITEIDQAFDGDTFFPEIPAEEWREISREVINDDSTVNFRYSFIKLARKIEKTSSDID